MPFFELFDSIKKCCRNLYIKSVSVNVCDIRSQHCKENCFDTDSMAPTHLTSAMNIKKRTEAPVDDILVGWKRKRTELNGNEESDSSEEEDVHRPVKKKVVQIIQSRKGDVNRPVKKKVVKVESLNDEDEKDSDYVAEDEDETDSDYEDEGEDEKDSESKDESEDEEDSESEEDDDDADYEVIKSGNVKKGGVLKPKVLKSENVKKDVVQKSKTSGLSSYEKMVEEKRAERMAFLQSIKIEEAKAGFSEAVGRRPEKKKTTHVKEKKRIDIPPMPTRRSSRLANMVGDLAESTLFEKALAEAEKENEKIIPPELSFQEALESEKFIEDYVKDINIQESKSEPKFLSYDKSIFQNLSLEECNITKVIPSRITALSWYPSVDNLVVAAGDKKGVLSIWPVGSDSHGYAFNIHTRGITNMQFNTFNPSHLISSSYDGTLRCGDMVKQMFNEVYNVSDETCCTYFDSISPTTYIVSHSNGQVSLVDWRTEGKKSEKRHTCHDYSIKTVDVHPVNNNFFVTAENKKTIRLWDLRKLQVKPVVEIRHHERCINSAFFSPVTGNSLLTTSFDNSICIFDSTNLTQDIKLKQRMKHDNQTGRWLSIFRATWLPNSDEAFYVGSMLFPRRIEVYDKDMNIYHLMMHDNLTTITSTNVFHPLRPAIAGGNSSGKLFVFT